MNGDGKFFHGPACWAFQLVSLDCAWEIFFRPVGSGPRVKFIFFFFGFKKIKHVNKIVRVALLKEKVLSLAF